MSSAAEPFENPDLFERLLEGFEQDDIVQAGRLLPERILAEKLGVGRRALRQALARLEADGVIWRRQGQGTFLASMRSPEADSFLEAASGTSPDELMQVRIEVEPILARLASLQASRQQVDAIRKAANEAANADSARSFERTDFAFHRAVAEGASNTLLLAMFDLAMTVLRQADWRVARQGHFSHSRLSEVSTQHDDIVEAIAARDPKAAESAMRAHLKSVYDYLHGH